MKRFINMFAGLSLAVLFFAASAHAQYESQRIVANIPFDFTVGKLSLPAGQYDFLRTGAGIFVIRDARGNSLFTGVTSRTQPGDHPDQSMLRFSKVDGHYALLEIWNEQDSVGNEFRYKQAPENVATVPTMQ
jgi:hypothetical protein